MSHSRWLSASLAIVIFGVQGAPHCAGQNERPGAKKAAGAQAPAAAPAGSKPSDTAAGSADRQTLMAEWAIRKRSEAEIHSALRTKISLDVEEMTLGDVLEKLSKENRLQIQIEKATVQDEGISLETPITLSVTDVTLRSVLHLVLEPQQMTTVIRNEMLTVTTHVKASALLESRLYEVHRLLERDDSAEVIDLLSACFGLTTSSEPAAGYGSVREVRVAKALSIRQTQKVHAEIAALLAELEGELSIPAGQPPIARPLDAAGEAEQAIRAKLAAKCSLKCEEETLEDLLTRIAREHSLPLWIDRANLLDEGISLESPITLDIGNVRLESVLNTFLEMCDLRWVIDDEVLKITTKDKAATMLVTRVYDIRDLESSKSELPWPPRRLPAGDENGGRGRHAIQPGTAIGGAARRGGNGFFELAAIPLDEVDDLPKAEPVEEPDPAEDGKAIDRRFLPRKAADLVPPTRDENSPFPIPLTPPKPPFAIPTSSELADLITADIEPESWDEAGGPGSIRWFRGLLVVRQTDAVQARIEDVLHEIRMHARRRQLDPQKAPPRPENPDELTLVIYEIEDYRPGDLEKLIPDVIAPESWKGAGGKGTLNVQPSALVIRQTRAVHREIVKLLYDVIVIPAAKQARTTIAVPALPNRPAGASIF